MNARQRKTEAEMWSEFNVWAVLQRLPRDSAARAWICSRGDGTALVIADPQGAFERLHDQIRDNEMEIRDARLAYRLAMCYDDATRWMIQNMLSDRVDHTVRWAMIESFGMGYATLRDCLAYDHGVSYLLACVVAFRLRSIGHGARGWL